MYEQQKNEFTKFLKPKGNIWMLIIFGIMFFFGIMMATVGEIILVGLIFMALAAYLIYIILRAIFQYPRYIQSLENQNMLPMILQDFCTAQQVYDGNLRFGRYYLYANGLGQVLPYQQITRVYQYIHRTNYIEDRRELRYVDPSGKVGTLCTLKKRGKSDADVHLIVNLLLRKNPSMQVGYQK
ncbi:MAG: hypothetical protein J6V25_09760 [Oscillospiraceae bacterium]|nr:hypothetical protein [Oscillospiraceae bacterium]